MTTQAANGIAPAHIIRQMVETGHIIAESALDVDQVQPASLDLRLGEVAWRVRASFMPGPRNTVADRLDQLSLHKIDLTDGAVLEVGCVYIVPLLEALALDDTMSAAANPKSSTGRLDIFTRVIADNAAEFDTVPAGYKGPLYAEISPRTFPILARTGSRLSQIRFRSGTVSPSDDLIHELHNEKPLVTSGDVSIDNGIALSVDLSSFDDNQPVGFRAKRHSGLVDVDRKAGL
ncbi:MAG: 2'-deoxycytidine 5'-triphosphate deaminase, partial [Pseudomonadota bacterium]